MFDIDRMNRVKLTDLTIDLIQLVKGIRESLLDDEVNAHETICDITDILKQYGIENEED